MIDNINPETRSDTDLNRVIQGADRPLGTHKTDFDTDDAKIGGRAEQDVTDPDHGVITTPSPKHPGSDDSADLPEGTRIEGTEIKR